MKSSNSGPIKLHNASTDNGDGLHLLLDSYGHVIVQVAGTFSADIHLEATIDQVTWYEVAALDLTTTNSNNKVKTLTGPGLYTLELIGGVTYFRARISSYSSGAVTVVANAHGG